jgi:hypothetical protein
MIDLKLDEREQQAVVQRGVVRGMIGLEHDRVDLVRNRFDLGLQMLGQVGRLRDLLLKIFDSFDYLWRRHRGYLGMIYHSIGSNSASA